MTDEAKALVEQLRDDESYYRVQEKHWCIDAEELERQRLAAADRIEALTAENERLREALEPFATLAEYIEQEKPHHYKANYEVQIEHWLYTLGVGELMEARAALGGTE